MNVTALKTKAPAASSDPSRQALKDALADKTGRGGGCRRQHKAIMRLSADLRVLRKSIAEAKDAVEEAVGDRAGELAEAARTGRAAPASSIQKARDAVGEQESEFAATQQRSTDCKGELPEMTAAVARSEREIELMHRRDLREARQRN